MGFVRALVALVLIAVAASPMLSGRLGTGTDVPSVFADSSVLNFQGRNDKDQEKKDKNRESDEDEKGNREKTREERREEKKQDEVKDDSARTTTNTLGLDNFQLEGQVVSLNCDVQPKEIVIHTVDGDATLYQGPRDTENRIDRLYCGDLIVGDYVFVHEAEKKSEMAYYAFYISCQQDREEGPDNTNDNDGDTDPNCAHIWGR
jgi:hypothetical protein